jgi:transposase
MELLHRRCCGLDVHKETVLACLRLVADGKVTTEVRTFQTTTADLLRLSKWLAENDCTHVAMEATGVYWKPVWHILDDGEFVLVLANAAHVKNVPGQSRSRTVQSLQPYIGLAFHQKTTTKCWPMHFLTLNLSLSSLP